MSADYPDLPYVHAIGDGGPRPRTQIIIIHATDNTASASGEASYATRREDGTSAHYYVDDAQTIQALPIGNIAYGALWHGNQVGVQYELCGLSNRLTDATIRRAAAQVVRDCARYGIPVRKLTAAQVRAGERGICGHADVTLAWPEDGGDHTDPGAQFPWSRFIDYVLATTAGEEDDMALDDIVTLADGRRKVLRDLLADLEQFRNAWIGDGVFPDGFPKPGSPLAKLLAAADRPAGGVMTAEQFAELKAELRAGLPSAAEIAEAVADEDHRRSES